MHAFYADMGGFLHVPGIDSPFPVDRQQILFLIQNAHLEYPFIPREAIADRNKTDGLARCLLVAQAVCFAVNCVIRVAQDLAITTLGLAT